MTRLRAIGLAVILMGIGATPAFADITGFIGSNTTPKNRHTQGFAAGAGLLIVAFEFEYASTPDDLVKQAPALNTGMGNVLLQTPVAIFGFQPYVTSGGGIYHETLSSHEKTGFALNSGGGVKISLVGPVRLRLDYRIFKLGDEALESPVQRFYAGLNLKF
jgi:opacity protein-like surface antigen